MYSFTLSRVSIRCRWAEFRKNTARHREIRRELLMPFLAAKGAREIAKHTVDTARTGSKCFATRRRLLPRNRGKLDLRRRGNVPRSLLKLLENVSSFIWNYLRALCLLSRGEGLVIFY